MTRRAQMMERVIRVRRVRARLALAALGRVQSRQMAEASLLARVGSLLGGPVVGRVASDAASARARADAVLGQLADDVGRRLSVSRDEQKLLAQRLARARAAVDAAVARRAEGESEL